MFRNKIVLLLLVVLMVMLTACQATDTASDTLISESLIMPEEVNYNADQVRVADFQRTVSGKAAVVYPYTATLSMKKTAKLSEILVSAGDQVEEGEVVAIFEQENRDTERANLQLKLQRAQESLEKGKADRLEAIAEKEEDNAKLQGHALKIAEVELEKLRISLEQYIYTQQRSINSIAKSLAELDEDINENVLVAPFAGEITSVAALFPGDQVAAGQKVVSMNATEYCWGGITDNTDELVYNREVEFSYKYRLDEYVLNGTIVAAPGILPDEAPYSYVLVDVEAPIPLNTIRSAVDYTFVIEDVPSALVVNRKAIKKEDGKSYVYLLEDDIVKKRYVQVGSNNMEVAWILDGLTEGQSVVID